MDGENTFDPSVQAEAQAGSTQAQNDPVDLTEAFKYLRQSNQEAAQSAEQGASAQPDAQQSYDVTATDGDTFGGTDQQMAVRASDGYAASDAGVPASSAYTAGGGDVGGSAAPVQAADYSPQMQRIAQQLQREARNEVLKNFTDKGIKMMSIGDIYERRDDGTIVFNNPDDPRRPFQSRKEAQDYIDSFNSQVQYEYDNQIRQSYANKMRAASPQFQLLQFAPYYDQMSQIQKDIFDDIIEPYAITKNGQTVGFNCNLVAAAKQAITIARRFEQPAQQHSFANAQPRKPVEQPATPAMDMKTGSGEADDDKEPTTIQEAWAMMNKQKKEKK